MKIVIHFVDGEEASCGVDDVSPDFEVGFSAFSSSVFVMVEAIFDIVSMDACKRYLMLNLELVQEDFESVATECRDGLGISFEERGWKYSLSVAIVDFAERSQWS